MYTWFRMYSEVIHDPKIRKLSPAQRWVWVGLLCLASESDTRGVLEIAPGVPYEPEDLASLLGAFSILTSDRGIATPVITSFNQHDRIFQYPNLGSWDCNFSKPILPSAFNERGY